MESKVFDREYLKKITEDIFLDEEDDILDEEGLIGNIAKKAVGAVKGEVFPAVGLTGAGMALNAALEKKSKLAQGIREQKIRGKETSENKREVIKMDKLQETIINIKKEILFEIKKGVEVGRGAVSTATNVVKKATQRPGQTAQNMQNAAKKQEKEAIQNINIKPPKPKVEEPIYKPQPEVKEQPQQINSTRDIFTKATGIPTKQITTQQFGEITKNAQVKMTNYINGIENNYKVALDTLNSKYSKDDPMYIATLKALDFRKNAQIAFANRSYNTTALDAAKSAGMEVPPEIQNSISKFGTLRSTYGAYAGGAALAYGGYKALSSKNNK